MQLTLGEVATLLSAPRAAPERVVRGYSIDSRSIEPGELFFALRGPRFDGHQFVGQAFQRGAAAAVVEREFRDQAPPSLVGSLLPVPNTLQALQDLARAIRRKWGRRLVAVTGSMGKSTTKEMIASLLGRRFSVLKSPGNLNNHYGVPLALLALEPAHEVAVVELAMSAPGEIARLAQIAEPEVGLVTNVAPVHLQFFDSLDSIALAKRELIENLISWREPPTAVLNYDDERVRKFAEGFAGRVVSFGQNVGADFRVLQGKAAEGFGSRFRVTGPNLDCEFRLPLPGWHNVQNALAAIAVARLFGVPAKDLQQALSEFENLPQRGEVLTLFGGVTVISDCYNSNPLAMESMLETLAAWPAASRRIVVAGEMLELGPTSPGLHRGIGRKCAESHVTWLLAVQGDARCFLEGALEAGFPPERARFFADATQAGDFCRTLLQPGDVVLVKGSRGVRLETVTELLRASSLAPAVASARQGPVLST
jgi:UDP-N-acetylmuramoyl-tripeptide--D-alanyl-D-alanine ligase